MFDKAFEGNYYGFVRIEEEKRIYIINVAVENGHYSDGKHIPVDVFWRGNDYYPAGIDENTIVTLTFEPDGSGVSVSIGGETINTVPKNNDKALWD